MQGIFASDSVTTVKQSTHYFRHNCTTTYKLNANFFQQNLYREMPDYLHQNVVINLLLIQRISQIDQAECLLSLYWVHAGGGSH